MGVGPGPWGHTEPVTALDARFTRAAAGDGPERPPRASRTGQRAGGSPLAGPPVRTAVLSARRLLRDALVAWLAHQPDFAVVGHIAGRRDLPDLLLLCQPDLLIVDAGGLDGGPGNGGPGTGGAGNSGPGTGGAGNGGAKATGAPARGRAGDGQGDGATEGAMDGAVFGDAEPEGGAILPRLIVLHERLPPPGPAGAYAFVPLSSGLDTLLGVLRRAADGLRDADPGPDRPDGRLSERERTIIALIGAGHTVSRIAALLGTTPCAVENSKRQIYRRFAVVGQSQLIARAAALGLLDPAAAPALAQPTTRDRAAQVLTPRENDILRSIALGHTVRQTARALAIAEKTVENTQARLFLKLGTHSRAGAVAAAYRLGLLDRADD